MPTRHTADCSDQAWDSAPNLWLTIQEQLPELPFAPLGTRKLGLKNLILIGFPPCDLLPPTQNRLLLTIRLVGDRKLARPAVLWPKHQRLVQEILPPSHHHRDGVTGSLSTF